MTGKSAAAAKERSDAAARGEGNRLEKTRLTQMLGEERVRVKEPMALHTTFRIGGPADYYVSVKNAEELQRVLACLKEEGEPWYILGRGSNLLVGDGGWHGCVIALDRMDDIAVEGNVITAMAGASLAQAAQAAREHGLTGLEFASGIPGSVGGALVMNAGAYGGSMDQVVREVTLLQDGEVRSLPAEEMHFAYRHSLFKETSAVALGCRMELQPGNPEEILAKMQELAAKRREKQPLEYPSAGSTFKRPEGMFAGKLIMDAGLRGFRIGDAQVSEKHCGFVVNRGRATAEEVREVIRSVQAKVEEQFGVHLEEEVIYLGEFSSVQTS